MINALFSDLSEDSAEKICGGVTTRNPSTVYAVNPQNSFNYGQFKKENSVLAEIDGNPSVVYLTTEGLTNYGQAK